MNFVSCLLVWVRNNFGAAVGKQAIFDGFIDTDIVSCDSLGVVRQEATTPLKVVTGFSLFRLRPSLVCVCT